MRDTYWEGRHFAQIRLVSSAIPFLKIAVSVAVASGPACVQNELFISKIALNVKCMKMKKQIG